MPVLPGRALLKPLPLTLPTLVRCPTRCPAPQAGDVQPLQHGGARG